MRMIGRVIGVSLSETDLSRDARKDIGAVGNVLLWCRPLQSGNWGGMDM